MRNYIFGLLIAGAFLLGTSAALASGGGLDTTFNGNGKTVFNIESATVNGSFMDVVVIGGGKYLVVGRAMIAGESRFGITLTRYNSDGTLDTSFGAGGKIITDPGVTAEGESIALQSDGKIIVAANSSYSGTRLSMVLRYTSDGALDTTFAGGTGVFFNYVMKVARDMVILPDNSILVGGDSDVPNIGRTAVTKLTPNGEFDNTFDGDGVVNTNNLGGADTDKIAVQPDGKILVSGRTLASVPKWLVFRFNANGSADTTFDTDGLREIFLSGSMYPGGFALQPDGKIVMGGFITVPGGGSDTQLMLTRLNSDGTTDSNNFGGGTGYGFYNLTSDYDRSSDLTIQSDGKILLAGHQDEVHAIVARFDAGGGLDPNFGTGGIASIPSLTNAAAIALQGSNIVAIGSGFSSVFRASRLNSSGTVIGDTSETFVVGKNDQARDVAIQTDGKIVTAGTSISGSNVGVVSLARTLPDGTLDPAFGNGGVATISDGTNYCEATAVAIQPDGKILVAGRGSQQMTFTYYSLFVARFNANGTPDNTFGNGGKLIITNPGNLIGRDMELQPDGKILVAGWVERVIGDGIFENDMMVARINTNGTSDGIWMSFIGSMGNFFFDRAYAMTIQPNGKVVLAGTHLLRLNADLSIDSTFTATPIPIVPATEVKAQADGKIVISGAQGDDFSLARFNPDASYDTTFGTNGTALLDFGSTDGANAFYIDTNGDFVVGGRTFAGASSRKKFALARFKSNGTPDSGFGSGGKVITDFGGEAEIHGVARQSDGKIVAAGEAKLSVDRDYAVARYLSRTGVMDFDGDTKTDISIFRPNLGEWWWLKSSNGGNAAVHFGSGTDRLVPGDYTGDGKTDAAFWRQATGEWFILRSEDGSYYSYPFGLSGDIPVAGDFDGDGKADSTIFRPSNATWYVKRSTGGYIIRQFGAGTDKPAVADYDNDGIADIAIWRSSVGEWWINYSSNGATIAFQFGSSSDRPVPGDYTGDGKADAAFYRPSTGEWFVLRSENFSYYSFAFGANGDLPAPGDYDGDGKYDAGVFRPSTATWYLNQSTAGILIRSFGLSGDTPVPGAYIP